MTSSDNLDKLKPMHRFVLDFFQKEKRGKLLDAPAGEGHLSSELSKLGFDVHCCDYYPENFRASNLSCQPVDLNAKLPYADATFNYIICLESVQYLENFAHLAREFSRILKKEGLLIISLPNCLNIESRLKFLMRGYLPLLKPLSEIPENENQRRLKPIACPTFLELKLILERYGCPLIRITTSKIKPKMYFFYPLGWIIKLTTLIGHIGVKNFWKKDAHRILASRPVLFGETLILITKKS